MNRNILETIGISKRFGNNIVLENINFSCNAGEIHALVGENGAGKSTLMKIISGVHRQTSGEIILNGKKIDFKNTLEAQKKGISIIHQEFNLVPYMSVSENIFLGNYAVKKSGGVNYKYMHNTVEELVGMMGVKIDPEMPVCNLTVAQQQMVEIIKAVNLDTKIIIMDEPTAALSQTEVEALFKLMRKLRAEGKTIIYISHRLNEIFEISDRITVMMDGHMVGTRETVSATKDEVVNMMVGRPVGNIFLERGKVKRGDVLLEVDDLIIRKGKSGASFKLYAGEILGMTGLEGQGQREIIRSLFGLYRPENGRVAVKGKDIRLNSPKAAVKRGISFLTDDRKQEGLCLSQPIHNNSCLPILSKLKRRGFLLNKYQRSEAEKHIQNLNIKAESVNTPVNALSGGNQQKVLLSKCLSYNPEILIVHEPTRGIDVGAKIEIYNLLRKLSRDNGVGILMVSSDLMEMINVSDRILVVYDGHINGEVEGKDATEDQIMRMATNIAGGK